MDIQTQLQIVSDALLKVSNLETENKILQSKLLENNLKREEMIKKLEEEDILLIKQEETLKKLNDIYCRQQHEDPQIKKLIQENKELQRRIICWENYSSKLEFSMGNFNIPKPDFSEKKLNDFSILKEIVEKSPVNGFDELFLYNKFDAQTLMKLFINPSNNGCFYVDTNNYGALGFILLNAPNRIKKHIIDNIDDMNAKDSFGWNVIHNIFSIGDIYSVTHLIKNGFNLYENFVEISAFKFIDDIICSRSTIEVIEYLLPQLSQVKLNKKKYLKLVKYNCRIMKEEYDKIILLLENL